MKLRNLFGDVALEETQKNIELDHGELLLEIALQLRIANVHLSEISGEKVTKQDIEDSSYVD